MNKSKKSLMGTLLGLVMGSLIIVGGVTLFLGVYNMRTGMEDEVETGVAAACKMYAEVLKYSAGEVDEGDNIEADMAEYTGYDYTFFVGSTRIRSSIDGVVGTEASDAVVETVINQGQSYQASDVNINGDLYYVAYEPLAGEDGDIFGMAFVGKKKAEVMGYINLRMFIMLAAAIVIMIIVLLVSIQITVGIVRAVKANVAGVTQMAEGNLSLDMGEKVMKRQDELGDMSRALQDMAERLQGVIGKARVSSDEVDDSAGYLSSTAQTISATADSVTEAITMVANGATNQAQQLHDAVESVNDINDAIQLITHNTDTMNELAESMQTNSKASSESLTELRVSTRETISSIDGIVELIGNTNNAVTTISEAVTIIDSIASQTNLLSLNASIEAARAGEAGRGFAVVADEIRELADQSAEAARNIQEAMRGLAADSNQTMEQAGGVQETVSKQRSIIHTTIEQVNSLISDIDKSIALTKEIAENVGKSDAAREVIADTISSLSSISQENAASSEETRASMQQLSDTVGELSDKASSLNDIAKGLEKEMSFFQ